MRRPLLLDTNILVHLIRGKELGRKIMLQFDLANAVHRPLISIVTVGEIRSLADQFQFGGEKREFLRKLLESLVVLDISDNSVIDAYVEVDRACHQAAGGARALSQNDLWIAATARAADAVLLTADKDFLFLHPHTCFVHYLDPKLDCE